MPKPSLAVGVSLIVVVLVALIGGQMVFAQVSGPEQPVGFTHMTHAGVLQLDCTFCHRNVDKGSNASVPAVQQCMFCHSVINGPDSDPARMAEIDKVQAASASGNPIDWMRVHRLPDHVRFVHEAHITAGVSCMQCHGDVASTGRLGQVRGILPSDAKVNGTGGALKMGDCVSCHRQNNAPTDCITCHK